MYAYEEVILVLNLKGFNVVLTRLFSVYIHKF